MIGQFDLYKLLIGLGLQCERILGLCTVLRYFTCIQFAEKGWERVHAHTNFEFTQRTQNICITFVQRWPNVFDVGPTLYKCYTNILCLLCSIHMIHKTKRLKTWSVQCQELLINLMCICEDGLIIFVGYTKALIILWSYTQSWTPVRAGNCKMHSGTRHRTSVNWPNGDFIFMHFKLWITIMGHNFKCVKNWRRAKNLKYVPIDNVYWTWARDSMCIYN